MDTTIDEKNLTMLRRKHLFVEMHELNDREWHETRRCNYGLEEDLEGSGWSRAHLPKVSMFRMMALRERLRPELVILDIGEDDESRYDKPSLEPVAQAIANHPAKEKKSGAIEDARARRLANSLLEERRARRTNHEDLPRAGSFSRLAELLSSSSSSSQRSSSEPPPPPPQEEQQSPPEPRRANSARSRRMTFPKSKLARPSLLVAAIPARSDALKPLAEEEAVHVLIEDQFDLLKENAVVVVRLRTPAPSGLEERVEEDWSKQQLLPRFIALGPRVVRKRQKKTGGTWRWVPRWRR
ncbi:hypothetical protein CTAYLR_001678 [Chrysophaeum taylorii]|uniref:Band 3 cytoplasmic domain-containing protein n=1 Tax=Chrysophaeum taylorii TaxID=2483200 RepID=A0AAD7U5D1_9STRA|nr:hypothetical protein CTAYLR_001678 [Chrysophaeum taylorii]